MSTCPFCGVEIQHEAAACGHCGAFKDTVLNQEGSGIFWWLVIGGIVFSWVGLFTDIPGINSSDYLLIGVSLTIVSTIVLGSFASTTKWYEYNQN